MLTMQQARAEARRMLGKNANVRINPRALDADEKELLPPGAEKRFIFRCVVESLNAGRMGSIPFGIILGEGDTWEDALAKAEKRRSKFPHLYGSSA